jgi:RNA polymerase sigma-70 factor (ECF subfamily)
MNDDLHSAASTLQAGRFATTRWSTVLAAGRNDSTTARSALERLCHAYWYPLYAFARRSGQSTHDAQDSVQEFLSRCVEKRYLASVDQAKGRFRSFLLTAFKRFRANEWDKAMAQKRGGAALTVSWDELAAEQRYASEPVDRLSADLLFDRRWALTVLQQVLARLRTEQAEAGKLEAFDLLKESLVEPGRGTPQAELATRLDMSEGAVKVAIHRLRRRYRELLVAEIAETVASPEELEEERQALLEALGS